MLQALEGHIIPVLQSQLVPQVLLRAPFQFDGFEHHLLSDELLEDKEFKPLELLTRWEEKGFSARRMEQFGFLFSGDYWEQVGVTHSQARELGNSGGLGLRAIHLKAPAAFYTPSYVPHGFASEENKDIQRDEPIRIFYVVFSESHCLLRLADSATGGTHNIYVRERQLMALKDDYVQALAAQDFRDAQMILLNMAKYLRGYLESHQVMASNTAWPDISTLFSPPPDTSPHKIALCHQAIDFIQFNLHSHLDTQAIADACSVSYMHLNRVFRATTGLPLMHWVTKCRLDAAQLMLEKTQERIADIATLVGFASTQSFSSVFSRHVGMSPRAYRKHYQNARMREIDLRR
jgi:AraC-like DNA-binding protein